MSRVALQPPSDKVGVWYISQAAEEVKQVATGRYTLSSLFVINLNASARYIWVFDNTASSGTVLCGPFKVAGSEQVSIEIPTGIVSEVGIRVAASSTGNVFTAAAADDFRMNVGYMPCSSRKDQ